ncbi:hypothetical protein [Streptosporangium sp. NPDC048865]
MNFDKATSRVIGLERPSASRSTMTQELTPPVRKKAISMTEIA